jgi:hypothetical protein
VPTIDSSCSVSGSTSWTRGRDLAELLERLALALLEELYLEVQFLPRRFGNSVTSDLQANRTAWGSETQSGSVGP